MATLDQLPAEQRAIVELVVQRGRSYDALADVLQVTPDRVRDLARDALTELSPRTAARVDPEWRGRVADYLLGQQSSAESRGTRTHLKESEASRAWALSLLDSLDPLYGDGGAPPVPEPVEDEPQAEPAPAEAPRRERARAGGTVEERARERARKPAEEERKRAPLRKQAAEEDDDDEDDRDRERPRSRDRDAADRPRERARLSPAAQEALKRRRLLGIVGGVVALAALVLAILAIAGVFSGDDDKGDDAGTSTTPAGQQPLQVLGQIALNPVGKSKAQGIAYIVQQNGKRSVVVQAQVPPLPDTQKVAAYEVWLYNSNGDARSLGAQYTDTRGVLQGRADLPADFAKYKSLDISRELFSDKNAGHGKSSVLRGAFASLAPVPEQQQGGSGGTQQPGAGGQQPGAGGQQPGAGGQQPGAGGQEPGAGGQQPGATQPTP